MKKAWEDAGESFDDPGEIEQTYYPDEGVVVLDFNPGDDDGR